LWRPRPSKEENPVLWEKNQELYNWSKEGFASIYWLMENDGSPKGKYIKRLTCEEAADFKKKRGIN